MHAMTPDGKTILLVDAYGLTRLTLPNKVKTERKVMATDESTLSLDAAGERAVVYDDLWDQIHVVRLADLKRVVSTDRFALRGAQLMPDGRSVVRFEDRAIERHDLSTRKSAHAQLPPDPKVAPTLSVGREGARRALLRQMLAVGADGTVAIARGNYERLHLMLGTVGDDARFTPTLERTIAVHGGGPLRMRVRDGGATLVVVSPSVGRAYVLRIDGDGAHRAIELPAVGVPTQDGDTWVTQTSPSEVARCDARGDVQARWNLSDPAHHGVGEVMARGGRVWFVPHDRTCVVELPSNTVIPRKLTPKEDPLRRYYGPLLARYNRAGAHFDRVFSLGRTNFWDSGRAASGSYTMSAGDGSLGANIVASALWGELCDGDDSALAPFRRGGTGAGFFTTTLQEPITVASVRRLFAACDAERVWLPFALLWIAEYFERQYPQDAQGTRNRPTPIPTPAAAAMLLRGVLAHLADVSAPPLSPQADDRDTPIEADEVIAALARTPDDAPQMPHRAFEGVAWMVARTLPPREAAKVLAWMALDGSARQHVNSGHGIGQALASVIEHDASLRDECWRALESHAPAPSNYGDDRRDALRTALRAPQG